MWFELDGIILEIKYYRIISDLIAEIVLIRNGHYFTYNEDLKLIRRLQRGLTDD